MERVPFGLIVALLLGLALRLVGIDALLPHAEEPDTYIVDQAALFRGETDAVPVPWKAWIKSPHLVGRVLAAVSAIAPEPDVAAGAPLAEHLARASHPTLQARVLVAWLSCLAIPAVWWLGRRLGGRHAGTLAALLMATSLLHVALSAQARPHAVLAATSIIAVAGAVWLRDGRGPWGTILVGLLGALALGTLHFGVFVLPALLAGHLLREETPRRPGAPRLVAGVAAVLLAVPAFYPFVLWPPDVPAAQMTGARSWLGAHDPDLIAWDPAGPARLPDLIGSADPTLFGLAAAALLIACVPRWRRRVAVPRGDVLVLLAFAVPLVVVMGGMPKLQQRYLVSLVPILAVFGGVLLASLLASRASGRRGLACALVVAVLAVPTATAARMAWLKTRPDTFEQATAWIEAERSRDSDRLLVESGLDLPLVPQRSAVVAQREVQPIADSRWQRTVRRTWAALPAENAWWFALLDPPGSARRTIPIGPEARRSVREQLLRQRATLVLLGVSRFQRGRSLYEAVAGSGELLASFPVCAGQDELRLANGYQDRDLFLRAWRAERWGAPLELFEIVAPADR